MSPRRRYRHVSRAEAISMLSDTDREIVHVLVEHRVASTQQIASLLGLPERTARHRLGRLYELGLAARPEKRGYSQEGSARHTCGGRRGLRTRTQPARRRRAAGSATCPGPCSSSTLWRSPACTSRS